MHVQQAQVNAHDNYLFGFVREVVIVRMMEYSRWWV